MKRLSDQTLYEILEVSVEAPPEEIERAYERARALYGPGSLATYTLMSPDEATLLNNRIEEAKVVLLDADARSRYDERIGVRPKGTPAPAAAPLAAPVVQAPVTQGAGTPWPPPSAPAATPVPEAAVASSTATVRSPEPP
ncbi:MAG TPA: DnaJ domain-containing protein, partial [Anaeromyxobacteraceae bacterium]|nr:DnaJ domain-containing protein [Anaeromyxobacteraceae bacterium]